MSLPRDPFSAFPPDGFPPDGFPPDGFPPDGLPPEGTPSGRGACDLGPCNRFSEDVHLLVDRELGEAETQAVEAHLQECPRCLGLANHLERMSSALKAWDQRENDIEVPTRRLRHAVLARVDESSVRRRRDDRFVRVLHLATAAVVLLGLGLGVVLGLRANAARSDAAASNAALSKALAVSEVSDAPSPLLNRERPAFEVSAESFTTTLNAWELAAGVQEPTFESPAERHARENDPRRTLVTDDHMKLFGGGDDEPLALLHLRAKRLDAFESRFGEPAMFWNGPYAGSVDQRVVPERTYRWLEKKGLLKEWRDSSTKTSSTIAGPSGVPLADRRTGVLPKDMLRPMQGITHPLRLNASQHLTYVPGLRLVARASKKTGSKKASSTKAKSLKTSGRLPPLLEAFAISDPVGAIPGLRSGPLGQPNRAFLDPIAAWGNKQLKFGESQHGAGTIVAFVKNTKQPIFIPAGQFITDGHGDRVVRHPTWLPPSKGETAHIIHCYVVQAMPRTTAQGVPQLSHHIAGPTIRALLASGASQAQIKAACRAIVHGAKTRMRMEFNEWTWSLRSFYVLNAEASAAHYERVRWSGTHGFLATDAQGRFLGFELVRISGVSAEKLLRRLWLSYVVEAIWRTQSPALRDAFAVPSDGAALVLKRLKSHAADFRVPAGADSPHGTRVSVFDLGASGVHIHALEVAGRPAIVSGLSSAK